MVKRKKIPKEIETEVLDQSRRRCCLCFGLNRDLTVKQQGQIAHLDGDPSNNDFGNLAYMCLNHHGQYDTRSYQSKGLTNEEVKRHRDRLYETMAKMDRASWPMRLDVPLQDVPLLDFSRPIDPTPVIPRKGIQLTDKDVEGGNETPLLSLSIYFKESRNFRDYISDENEKWLYIEANVYPALTLRIQVRAWSQQDVSRLMTFLSNNKEKYLPGFLSNVKGELLEQSLSDLRSGWDLHGPNPESDGYGAGDHFRVWRENDENKLLMFTFTPTKAVISIHARFSDKVATEFANYLEEVGFAKPFNE